MSRFCSYLPLAPATISSPGDDAITIRLIGLSIDPIPTPSLSIGWQIRAVSLEMIVPMVMVPDEGGILPLIVIPER
jgi:hypothetical protein